MSSSTSSSRGEARKALRQLLLLAVFLFAFDRLIFMAIRRGEALYYRNITSYSLKDKFAAVRDKQDIRVLVLGTSRTFDGVHPRFIEKELGVRVFKEAFVGKGPMYNYFFYQEYRRQVGIPRLVIYGVDYFLFNITSERHWMKRFPAEQVDESYFKGGISMLLANKPQIDEFSNSLLNDLKANLGGDSNYEIERDPARMENYLGKPSPGTIDTTEPPRFTRIYFHGFPGKEGEYFVRLLDQLQQDRVHVLLISLPEYIGTFWTNRSHKKFQRVFSRFARRRSGVYFINYNQPGRFDLERADLFIDGGYGNTNSHLSQAGAEIFNRMLVDDLRRYWLAFK